MLQVRFSDPYAVLPTYGRTETAPVARQRVFSRLNDFFAYIDSERRKIQFRVMKARYTGKTVCPDCGGSRLRKEALYVRIGGKTIATWS